MRRGYSSSRPASSLRPPLAWLPMTSAAFDAKTRTPDLMSEAIDRRLNPWRYPDRASWPSFVLLPVLERARMRVSVARGRALGAWSVLVGRESIYEDDTMDDALERAYWWNQGAKQELRNLTRWLNEADTTDRPQLSDTLFDRAYGAGWDEAVAAMRFRMKFGDAGRSDESGEA